MNGENQTQQEQHRLAERVTRLEVASEYQGKEIADMREEMRGRFDRIDDKFNRIDDKFDRIDDKFEKLQEQRNRDFHVLLGISMTTVLGTVGLLVKVFGLL